MEAFPAKATGRLRTSTGVRTAYDEGTSERRHAAAKSRTVPQTWAVSPIFSTSPFANFSWYSRQLMGGRGVSLPKDQVVDQMERFTVSDDRPRRGAAFARGGIATLLDARPVDGEEPGATARQFGVEMDVRSRSAGGVLAGQDGLDAVAAIGCGLEHTAEPRLRFVHAACRVVTLSVGVEHAHFHTGEGLAVTIYGPSNHYQRFAGLVGGDEPDHGAVGFLVLTARPLRRGGRRKKYQENAE